MHLITKDGKAEPMPLSDLQENNRLMKKLKSRIEILAALGIIVVIYVLAMTWYIIDNNVVNNIVASCV